MQLMSAYTLSKMSEVEDKLFKMEHKKKKDWKKNEQTINELWGNLGSWKDGEVGKVFKNIMTSKMSKFYESYV